jgi:2-amino-4-hydroxy-6-hydroxymethyldihydropteridine diphosphokinase
MEDVYLLFGSNKGHRQQNIENALAQVGVKAGGVILASSLYETEPWGLKEQQNFVNRAALIRTDLEPADLLAQLKSIEHDMGRVENQKWGPRIIDIDILFYGNKIIDTPDLKIPHPFIQERRFTLIPLFEIAPHLVHPVSKQTVAEMLQACADNSEVKRV